ncbi:hypothetical protein B0T26DRAFT_681637 [Lasiosphaeria miniovina]|uniref:Uncharacterized protein n=1 Tax=Lasiosphaeria miniovina TaxID=1954250 RepID=A0AA39ZUR1_9PEZI|nr:uncharacterized protein B0T26DRAFT_681637 [Lasiosphaeria miniovina]KAK0704023.1 hypothetical protein B0T26DRAFT_681637 [Lasiosphaeria miniovina]
MASQQYEIATGTRRKACERADRNEENLSGGLRNKKGPSSDSDVKLYNQTKQDKDATAKPRWKTKKKDKRRVWKVGRSSTESLGPLVYTEERVDEQRGEDGERVVVQLEVLDDSNARCSFTSDSNVAHEGFMARLRFPRLGEGLRFEEHKFTQRVEIETSGSFGEMLAVLATADSGPCRPSRLYYMLDSKRLRAQQ